MHGRAILEPYVARVLERAALHAAQSFGIDREGSTRGVDSHVGAAVRRCRKRREPSHVGGLDTLARDRIHEQRHVGEVLAERLVVEALVDDDLGDGQREGRVGVGFETYPLGRLLGRGRVVGVEVHDLAAVFARDIEEVRIGQTRDHDIRTEDHRVLGVFPAIRLELLALHAEGLGPEHRKVAVHLVTADGRPAHHVG